MRRNKDLFQPTRYGKCAAKTKLYQPFVFSLSQLLFQTFLKTIVKSSLQKSTESQMGNRLSYKTHEAIKSLDLLLFQ